MKRFIIYFFISFFTILQMNARKVNPVPFDCKQPDGTTVTVKAYGDETFHYLATMDGMLVVNTENGVYVARISDDNELIATNVLAHNADMRTEEETAIAKEQDTEKFKSKGRAYSIAQNVTRAKSGVIQQTPSLFPHLGEPHVLVLLADFSDKKFDVADPVKCFDQYLNKEGAMEDIPNSEGISHSESRNYSSVGSYFRHISNGKFKPVFDVVDGIVHLSESSKYYGYGKDRMGMFVPEACKYAAEVLKVDFSKYDVNNDGYCDLVYIIYAGQGEQDTYIEDQIWAKSGYINGGTYNGKKIARYGVSCELSANAKKIEGIGVFCHEFSHCLGFPDFYYTYTDKPIDNQGMEYWSIMDWAFYLPKGMGTRPAPYTAWEKEDMDWYDGITTVHEDGHYCLYDQSSDKFNALKIVNPKNTKEYLILENIQQKGFAGDMLGKGLQVTHVNYYAPSFELSSNNVNNVERHPRMTIVPADGALKSTYNDFETYEDLLKEAEGDLFPGKFNVTELSTNSKLPNFDWFTQTEGGSISSSSPTFTNYTKLYNIKEIDGRIELDIVLDTTTGLSLPTVAAQEDKTYNLQGQQVGSNFHGIIIKGGKKYLRP